MYAEKLLKELSDDDGFEYDADKVFKSLSKTLEGRLITTQQNVSKCELPKYLKDMEDECLSPATFFEQNANSLENIVDYCKRVASHRLGTQHLLPVMATDLQYKQSKVESRPGNPFPKPFGKDVFAYNQAKDVDNLTNQESYM